MPRYTTQQDVWALQIKAVNPNPDGSATIVPVSTEYAPFTVGLPYVAREKPKAGGFFVTYAGGHQVFRDCDTFNLHFKEAQ